MLRNAEFIELNVENKINDFNMSFVYFSYQEAKISAVL